jgi:glycosyltransferase involved in cell wall biosynthesis
MFKTVFLTEDFRLRKSQLIHLLSERTEIEVLCFEGRHLTGGNVPEGTALTAVERDPGSFFEPLKRILHPFTPPHFDGLSESMIDALRARVEPCKFLWISGAGVSPYVPVGRKLGYRVVYDAHQPEIQHRLKRAKSMGAAVGHLPTFFSNAQGGFYRSKICTQAHAVVEASDLAASQISRLAPHANVHVVPDTVDSSVYEEVRSSKGESLLFFGPLDSTGNLRGISWFIDEVLPRLRASLKERVPRVVVAGANPPRHLIRRLHYESIELHANPKSMLPLLSDAAIVFFPQRYGLSSTHQILEAMASGRPVVSTPKAAEGLLFSPTYDLLVADRADSFTRGIVQLVENPDFRSGIASHALETVNKRYDRNRARESLEKLLSLLAETPAGPTDRKSPGWSRR